jgi:hypothetical protein
LNRIAKQRERQIVGRGRAVEAQAIGGRAIAVGLILGRDADVVATRVVRFGFDRSDLLAGNLTGQVETSSLGRRGHCNSQDLLHRTGEGELRGRRGEGRAPDQQGSCNRGSGETLTTCGEFHDLLLFRARLCLRRGEDAPWRSMPREPLVNGMLQRRICGAAGSLEGH